MLSDDVVSWDTLKKKCIAIRIIQKSRLFDLTQKEVMCYLEKMQENPIGKEILRVLEEESKWKIADFAMEHIDEMIATTLDRSNDE